MGAFMVISNDPKGGRQDLAKTLNHGETENGDPLWGLNAVMPVRPIHGGFGGHFAVIWTQFMVVWIHGGL